MDHLVLAALAALAVLAWPLRPHRPSPPGQPSGGSRYRHGVREPGRAATTYAVADALVLLSLALRSGMGQREALEHGRRYHRVGGARVDEKHNTYRDRRIRGIADLHAKRRDPHVPLPLTGTSPVSRQECRNSQRQ